MLSKTPETAESGGGLVVTVVAILYISGERFKARGEVRKEDEWRERTCVRDRACLRRSCS